MTKDAMALSVGWRPDGDMAGPGTIAIIVDVLRATTTLTTAFSVGAVSAEITTEVDKAREMAAANGSLLMGERHNKRVEGFDFGSSPAELAQVDLTGKSIVFTSTNCPHALEAVKTADAVLLGALVNVTAAAEQAKALARNGSGKIRIILAGEPSEAHSGEDHYFACLAVQRLADDCVLDGSCHEALERFGDRNPAEAEALSIHAAELRADGFGADVDFAFQVDRYSIVPRWQDGKVTAS